jgi:hypothetical protein
MKKEEIKTVAVKGVVHKGMVMARESTDRQGTEQHDTLQQGGEGSRDAEKKNKFKVVLQKLTADSRLLAQRSAVDEPKGGMGDWRVVQQRRGRDRERDEKGHAIRAVISQPSTNI